MMILLYCYGIGFSDPPPSPANVPPSLNFCEKKTKIHFLLNYSIDLAEIFRDHQEASLKLSARSDHFENLYYKGTEEYCHVPI